MLGGGVSSHAGMLPHQHHGAIHHPLPPPPQSGDEIISLTDEITSQTDSLNLGYRKIPPHILRFLERKKALKEAMRNPYDGVGDLFIERRSVVENGQLVVKPATKCYVFLKDGPPEGSDKDSYYLQFLGKVSSNPSEAYYGVAWDSYNVFGAKLTKDEYAKVQGMDEVEKVMIVQEVGTIF